MAALVLITSLLCYAEFMTKLLDQAIAKVRALPEAEQDSLARVILPRSDETVDRATQRLIVEHALRATGEGRPPSKGCLDTPM